MFLSGGASPFSFVTMAKTLKELVDLSSQINEAVAKEEVAFETTKGQAMAMLENATKRRNHAYHGYPNGTWKCIMHRALQALEQSRELAKEIQGYRRLTRHEASKMLEFTNSLGQLVEKEEQLFFPNAGALFEEVLNYHNFCKQRAIYICQPVRDAFLGDNPPDLMTAYKAASKAKPLITLRRRREAVETTRDK